MNDKKHVLVVFIDFSKAFDLLVFDTLFMKLENSGIQGSLLEWFKDYHRNRLTYVKIDNAFGNSMQTTKGTAQGSILGPTEYLLYVNEMCSLFEEGSVYQFADDTCIVVANKDLQVAEKMMQTNFDMLCKWAHDMGLVINAKKTKAMHIHTAHNVSNHTASIVAHMHDCLHGYLKTCNCPNIEMVYEHMYIGLKIDRRFNWQPHINYVCNKLRALLSKLFILKYKLPYRTLRLLYLALADSIIDYGLSSYGRTYSTFIGRIYSLQVKILKTIVPEKIKMEYSGNYGCLFKYCKLLPVQSKVRLAILKEEYNNIQNIKSIKRNSKLRKLSSYKKFSLPKTKNIHGKRKWSFSLPKIMNDLPQHIIDVYKLGKKKTFIRKTKMYFLDKLVQEKDFYL